MISPAVLILTISILPANGHFCPICERDDSQFEGELAQNSSISQSLFSPFREGNGDKNDENDNSEWANFVATVFPTIRFNW
jgi:hypothetical protein